MADKSAFEVVCAELERGAPLTLEQVGEVFGAEFFMLLVYCLMDAGDAARAIQGAINRLRNGEQAPEEPRH